MSMRISGRCSDGSGSLNEVAINERGEMLVESNTKPARLIAAENGNAYILHSGYQAYTNAAGFTGAFYIKNTSTDKSIHIDKVRLCSTATGYVRARFYRNPTTGTLISGGNTVTPVDADFGSGDLFSSIATTLYGDDGDTVTDGTMFETITFASPGQDTISFEGALILRPGNSIAIDLEPSVDSTVCTAWNVYIENYTR